MIKTIKKWPYLLGVLFCVLFAFGIVGTGNVVHAEEVNGDSPGVLANKYGVLDHTGIFGNANFSSLEKTMEEIYRKKGISVYIISTESDNKYNEDAAVEEVRKIVGDQTDSIVLFISYFGQGDRRNYFRCDSFGYNGVQAYTGDRRMEELAGHLDGAMRSRDYKRACEVFVKYVEKYLKRKAMFDAFYFQWWFHLIGAIVVVGLVILIRASSLHEKVTVSNATYMDSKNSRIPGRFDRYTHTTETRTRIESDSSGGGGGGGGGGHSGSSNHGF